MKKFQFKLESVIKNYKFKEEEKKIKLAEKEQEYNLEKKKMLELEQDLSRTLKRMEKEKKKFPDMEIINLYEKYSEAVKKRINGKKFLLNQLQKKLDEIRKELLEIIKNKKIIEKLKEKKWQEYMFEFNVMEQKNLDEIAQIQFNRKEEL